jgi:hypothetical protein
MMSREGRNGSIEKKGSIAERRNSTIEMMIGEI